VVGGSAGYSAVYAGAGGSVSIATHFQGNWKVRGDDDVASYGGDVGVDDGIDLGDGRLFNSGEEGCSAGYVSGTVTVSAERFGCLFGGVESDDSASDTDFGA